MNKTDLLLQMLEQPHQYTADEWQEILADDECRELYTLMSKTQSAVDATRAEEGITDEMIDAEWQYFLTAQYNSQLSIAFAFPRGQRFSIPRWRRPLVLNSQIRKLAAIFIGILLISGIAYAAIHLVRQHQKAKAPQTEQAATIKKHVILSDTLRVESTAVDPVIYDNVPLEKMLPEIAAHYGASVTFRDDAARQLRLFYQWRHEYTIEKVVEMLNNFETLQLHLEGDTLFVSSTINQ